MRKKEEIGGEKSVRVMFYGEKRRKNGGFLLEKEWRRKERVGTLRGGKKEMRERGLFAILIWRNRQGPSGPFSNYRPDGPL